MKKVLLVILAVIIVLIIGLLAFSGNMGMFSKIEVYEKEIGPYNYAYKEFRGDYKLTGPVFDEVYNILTKNGIQNELGIGIYHDDPAVTSVQNLRSDCGSIISEEDSKKIQMLNSELKIGKMEKSKRAIVEFRIKNSLSYMFGPMKAYPALSKYAQERGYKQDVFCCEIYDVKAGKILFVMDIVK